MCTCTCCCCVLQLTSCIGGSASVGMATHCSASFLPSHPFSAALVKQSLKKHTQNYPVGWGPNWKCILLESRLPQWWNESYILTIFSGACTVQEIKTLLCRLWSSWRFNTSSTAQQVFQAISIFMNFLDTFLIFHLKMCLYCIPSLSTH